MSKQLVDQPSEEELVDRSGTEAAPIFERGSSGLAVGLQFRLVLLGAVLLPALMLAGEGVRVFQPARLVLGVIYVLYIPGYCLSSALFPRADELDGIERAGLSIGLSIALVPALALLLDQLPWGLRPWPILIGTYTIAVASLGVAAWRRARLPLPERAELHLDWQPWSWWQSAQRTQRRLSVLWACILVTAGLAAAWGLVSANSSHYLTEFYILGGQGLAEDFVREAVVGEDVSVTIGIANRERSSRAYSVEGWAINPWQTDQRKRVYSSDSLVMAPGEVREWPASWRMPWAGEDQVLEFLLFSDSSDEPYRVLRLWMNVIHE